MATKLFSIMGLGVVLAAAEQGASQPVQRHRAGGVFSFEPDADSIRARLLEPHRQRLGLGFGLGSR